MQVSDAHYFPTDVLYEIFRHLDPESLSRSARVCKKWKELSDKHDLWRVCFRRAFECDPPSEKDPKNEFINRLLLFRRISASSGLAVSVPMACFYSGQEHQSLLHASPHRIAFVKDTDFYIYSRQEQKLLNHLPGALNRFDLAKEKQIAFLNDNSLIATDGEMLAVWDLNTRENLYTAKTTHSIHAANHRYLFYSTDKNRAVIYDLIDRKSVIDVQAATQNRLGILEDQTCWIKIKASEVASYFLGGNEPRFRIQSQFSEIHRMDLNSGLLVMTDRSQRVYEFYDSKTGARVDELSLIPEEESARIGVLSSEDVKSLVFDGYLIGCIKNHQIFVWDLHTRQLSLKIDIPQAKGIHELIVHHERLVLRSHSEFQLYNLSKGELIRSWTMTGKLFSMLGSKDNVLYLVKDSSGLPLSILQFFGLSSIRGELMMIDLLTGKEIPKNQSIGFKSGAVEFKEGIIVEKRKGKLNEWELIFLDFYHNPQRLGVCSPLRLESMESK